LDVFRREVGGDVKIFGHYNDYNESPRYEEAAAMAAVLQTEGADGAHLFNFWNDVIDLNPDKQQKLLGRLNVLKRDAWRGKKKYYGYGLKEVGNYQVRANSQLPAKIGPAAAIRYLQTVGDDFSRLRAIDAQFVIVTPSGANADFRVSVNDAPADFAEVVHVKGRGDRHIFAIDGRVLKSGVRANAIQVVPEQTIEIREMGLSFALEPAQY
jgi:hypothetical protein